MTEGKTLTELNVQPGDVVRHVSHKDFTIAGRRDNGEWFAVDQSPDSGLCDVPEWRIVSRANPEPTRADLEAQIAALQAKLDAMPRVMRLWVYKTMAHGWLVDETFMAEATHYLDIPVDADGVPVGIKEIKK